MKTNGHCPLCHQPFPIELVEWNNDTRILLVDGRAVYFPERQGFIINMLWMNRRNAAGLTANVVAARYYQDGGPLNATKVIHIQVWHIRTRLKNAGIVSVSIPNHKGKRDFGYRLVIEPSRAKAAA